MSVKKLSFYLTDTEITPRSDHLPLKKFLLKNMLNSKVNNWAVELVMFNIHFEHISGIWNTLTDTLSRIIRADPDMKPDPEGGIMYRTHIEISRTPETICAIYRCF